MATEVEVQAFRDQISRLIGEKVQLENRVIELERARSEMAIEGLAAASVRSVRSAEEAMAAEVPGSNFRVPELEVTVRGYVSASEGAVLLRLPRPELMVPPEHLGTIRMLAVGVPAASTFPREAPPVRPSLAGALEQARAAFGKWQPRIGNASAHDISARAGELSIQLQNLLSATAQATLESMARAATRFSRSLVSFAGEAGAADFRAAARRFASLVKTPHEPEALAEALRDLVRTLESVRSKSPGKQ